LRQEKEISQKTTKGRNSDAGVSHEASSLLEGANVNQKGKTKLE